MLAEDSMSFDHIYWPKYFHIFIYFNSKDMSIFGLAGSSICQRGKLVQKYSKS